MQDGEMELKLIPLRRKYLEFIRQVRNDPLINKYLFTNIHISKEEQERWYKQRYLRDKNYLIFIALDDKTPIGYGQIVHIDNLNYSCELGFCIKPEFQGKGYGKALVDKLVNHSFNVLKMHRIYLEVFVDNERALKLYEKYGFKKEGILRDKILKNGVFKDVLIMSIINNKRNDKIN